MYFSIRGKVICFDHKFLIIENNGIGYEILVAKPEDYQVNQEVFLFLHHEIKEDDEYLVGFKSLEEKNAFKVLLHVNGIGPKSAMQILANCNYDQLLEAISNSDLELLKTLSGTTERVASQILLDLKEFIAKNNRENIGQYKEIKEALKALKFKVKDIDKVLPNIYIANGTKEQIMKEALRRLAYVQSK